jgi:hypothetical protein
MRKSGLALIAALWVQPAAAQDVKFADWFSVPSDQSAISIYFEPQQQDVLLSVEDAAGKTIETVNWHSGVPLVRQYRIQPGVYSLRFEGLPGEFVAKAAPGEMTSFVVREDAKTGLEVALKADPFSAQYANVSGALETMVAKFGLGDVEPITVTPARNELNIRFAPPGVRPPPK